MPAAIAAACICAAEAASSTLRFATPAAATSRAACPGGIAPASCSAFWVALCCFANKRPACTAFRPAMASFAVSPALVARPSAASRLAASLAAEDVASACLFSASLASTAASSCAVTAASHLDLFNAASTSRRCFATKSPGISAEYLAWYPRGRGNNQAASVCGGKLQCTPRRRCEEISLLRRFQTS
eukprot:TRINITY_DN17309_c0_g1_i2.p2 TRINITY_DN17309_c0_g1~~TRINITY_DN17309_c0_g1_i2.p2  ORF type:complete len:209 (+),score=13.97 TRINITY_DN17309_c0_g1_i2:69-629(+)